MANKKFFWIKLKQDFFNDPYIKLLRRMAGGDTYTIIYLEMLVKSASTGGMLYFQGAGQDIAEELSLILDENVEDVRALLAYLEAKKLITHPEIKEDVFLVASADLTGSETDSAMRMRKFRERQMLHGNGQASLSYADVTDRYDKKEIETELDIETEREQETENKKSSVVTPAKTMLLNSLQANGFFVSPNSMAFDNLIAFHEQDGMEIEVVIKAVEDASAAGKSNVSYINGILNNKLSNDIKTLDQYNQSEKVWQSKQSNRQAESDLTPEQAKWLADRQRKRERNATS
ncbi:DnaD domain protein [Weissella paramesenteroides]|uniref:phage replisome organizer N-terminal domain-containing protein n=1 Tax=Weissella paramesenteroides TaxID=1249 RepID=UPI0012390E5C|nr:phage replisome organizer N-terminal domain-containing protein [Weissella paramesenteroides]KAA8442668.1 DnaD domain protein [Weissella paramesenteroides]KAA8443014.1 DnaD domain protein [Weissella paramesenteroides]KAA8444310.1 DnaD domain protein [Weissella paramesenteroides]KAA8447978.1 DnaD domain protein [Weissella paramesenteroides]KAA8452209.1 DnaD domain protein [Weissella paramesenteroides]